jgi:hypothetical protein
VDKNVVATWVCTEPLKFYMLFTKMMIGKRRTNSFDNVMCRMAFEVILALETLLAENTGDSSAVKVMGKITKHVQ